jgi:Uncharacterized conserved protein (COG2071)
MESRAFAQAGIPRPTPRGIDAYCILRHFSLITYAVPVERVSAFIHPRFRCETIMLDGQEKALLSVVPFEDEIFTSAVFPFPHFCMGQTNYRIYVKDTVTNQSAVWFLGTTLDSWTVALPRYYWKLPWHRGRVRFSCEYHEPQQRYTRYSMTTQSAWAPAALELDHVGGLCEEFPGFPDPETGLVILTHPLTGYYYRRDGRMGSYAIWHDKLPVTNARLRHAAFGLLDRLQIVPLAEQLYPYQVAIVPRCEFTVYLPPKIVEV